MGGRPRFERVVVDVPRVCELIPMAVVLGWLGITVDELGHGQCPGCGPGKATFVVYRVSRWLCCRCRRRGKHQVELYAKVRRQPAEVAAAEMCGRVGVEIPVRTVVEWHRLCAYGQETWRNEQRRKAA